MGAACNEVFSSSPEVTGYAADCDDDIARLRMPARRADEILVSGHGGARESGGRTVGAQTSRHEAKRTEVRTFENGARCHGLIR